MKGAAGRSSGERQSPGGGRDKQMALQRSPMTTGLTATHKQEGKEGEQSEI